ncbi:hypothetical protein SBA6_840024 [Candidatus Sulfopaludibacter sp. SbA6]|nr:hypothetical protein SBA6_840024 [Candidatus Sulfopaludibacter sp. SbA6]
MKNEVIGPEIRRGQQEGGITALRLLIEKRFSAPPDLAEERFSSRSASHLEGLIDCVLDAKSLEELLQ